MIRYKVGDANLNIKIAKEEFPDLLRMLSANVDDLEAKTFKSFPLQSSNATYYKNTTIVENGHRKTTFEENKITMSSAFEMSRELAKFIAMALQQGYDRSTNELKKLASVCLTFGNHLRCLIGDSTMTESHLVD